MKKPIYKIALLIMISVSRFATSQNLVPNPSFEEYSSCPDNISQIYKINGWYMASPNPDYFNSCSPMFDYSIPNNFCGYQCAATGMAYCGVITHNPVFSNQREILGCKLIDPLIPGNLYYINLKISLAEESNCATDKFGVFLSMDSISDSITINTNIVHLYINEVIIDSINWTVITGSFIADSAYQYMLIGNLFNDNNTNMINFDTNSCWSYYYVDDVCVSLDSLFCADMANQMIDIIIDTTYITKGDCINFNVNSVIDYGFYNWLFTGAFPSMSTDSNPSNICYNDTGLFSVTLIISDSSGCGDTINKKNYISVYPSVGFENYLGDNDLRLYPNPVQEKIYMRSGILPESTFGINIYDIFGRKIKEGKLLSSYSFFNVDNLSDGVYFVELYNISSIIVLKSIIINKTQKP